MAANICHLCVNLCKCSYRRNIDFRLHELMARLHLFYYIIYGISHDFISFQNVEGTIGLLVVYGKIMTYVILNLICTSAFYNMYISSLTFTNNINMHGILVSRFLKRIEITTRKYSGKKETPNPQKNVDPRRIFKVYRYAGIFSKEQPKLQSYELDVSTCGKMVLDALIKLKDMDPSLSFRRSCREGICGSCAINLQGRNCLSCITEIPPNKKITIYPLPHMYVIRDLVVDMTHFFKGYNSIRPYLVRRTPKPMGSGQYAQSVADNDMMVGLYECVLCSCCATACPSYWWNGRRFLGPATLLHAYRWVIDSRDDDTEQRLHDLRDDFKAFRCHTIMNCTLDCPKGLHPAMAIAKLKRLISGLDKKPRPEIDPMKFGSAGSLEQCIKKKS